MLLEFSKFLNSEIITLLLVLLLSLIISRKREDLIKIAIVLILTSLIVLALKYILKIERPCVFKEASIECPKSYSYPSWHAAVFFSLAMLTLRMPIFAFYLFFSLLVGLSRIYLEVHTFEDVIGGYAIGAFCYLFIENKKSE